jgi:hypothetical protein
LCALAADVEQEIPWPMDGGAFNTPLVFEKR